MSEAAGGWVWFLDEDLVQSLLAVDTGNAQLQKRAATHPSIVEAVQFQLAGKIDAALAALRPAHVLGNPDALLLGGQIAFEAGRLEEAISHYRKLADVKPDHPYANLNAGICLARLRRWRQAIESLQSAVLLDPDRPQSWFVLGVCLLNEHRAAEARGAFARSLKLREEYAPAWFGQAAALQLEGKHDEALVIYERLLAEQPRNVEVLENALSAARHLENGERIRRYSERLAKAAPHSIQALWAQLVMVVEDSDYGSASEIAATLAEANPTSSADWYNLGVCLQRAGKWEQSAVAYESALQLSPDDPDAWCGLGSAQWACGQKDKAGESYEQAIELQPNHPTARRLLLALALECADVDRAFSLRDSVEDSGGEIAYGLAALLHRNGQLDRAADLYREAVGRNPKNAEGHWNLGHALFALNRVDEARRCWRAAIEMKPELALAELR